MPSVVVKKINKILVKESVIKDSIEYVINENWHSFADKSVHLATEEIVKDILKNFFLEWEKYIIEQIPASFIEKIL